MDSASASGLTNIQEVFSAYHLTLAKQSKLSIFLRELSTSNRRGTLTFTRIQAVCTELVFPSLHEVLGAADALSELEGLLDQATNGSSSSGDRRGTAPDSGKGDERLLEDLGDAVFVSSLVGALFVSGRDADTQLGLKSRRLAAELQVILSKGMAMQSTMSTILSDHLLALGKHRYLQHIDLAHQVMSEGQQQMLGTLLASRPQLRYVDLSYCLLKDAFVKTQVAPAFTTPQSQIVVLMLNGNALTDASGALLLKLAVGGAEQVLIAEELAMPPTLAPRLQVLDCGKGNELTENILPEIDFAMTVRGWHFAPVAPHHHLPPHYEAIPKNTADPTKPPRHRVMAFDGGVMTNLSQVYWLQQCLEANAVVKAVTSSASPASTSSSSQAPVVVSDKKAKLLQSWKALPDLSQVNTFAGSGFGAIVAAAMALGTPMDEVQSFFIKLADQVFLQGHYTYYALVAGRMLREWWTGGNYYSASTLKQELEKLFGARTVMECRRPYPGTATETAGAGSSTPSSRGQVNLILVAGTHSTTPDTVPSECSVFTSYQHSHLKVVDVLMACCSFPGFFAPFLITDSSVGSLPPTGSGNKNLARTEGSYIDAEEVAPNPSLAALLELTNYVQLRGLQVDSVSTTVEEHHPAQGVDAAESDSPLSGLLKTPLLVKAITTHGLNLSPEERKKQQNAASRAGGGVSTMPSTPSVLRERRLDSACQATHATLARCFFALEGSAGGNHYQRRVLSTATAGNNTDAEDHRKSSGQDTTTAASGCRIGLDEDNTFLLNEVLWNDIALWIRRPTLE